MKTLLTIFISMAALLFFTACGGGGGSDGDSTPPQTSLSGEVIYGPTQGIDYICSSGIVGTTSSLADFSCNIGDNISFYIGSVLVATLDAKTGITTPYDFFPNDITAALNYSRLLQALNVDGSNAYGDIILDETLLSMLPSDTDFSDPNFEDTIETLLGVTLIDEREAQHNLNQAILDAGGTLPDGVSLPFANAGIDQSITVLTGTLDGSSSIDPDGNALTYFWSVAQQPLGSNAILSSTDVVNPNFSIDLAGIYQFDLVVNNGISDSLVDSVDITLSIANLIPIANAGIDQSITVLTGTLNASSSIDPEGDPLTYLWTVTRQPAGSDISLSTSTLVTTNFLVDIGGTYYIDLVVNDGISDSSIDSIIITITPPITNLAPTAHAGTNQNVLNDGSSVAISGSLSTDPENDILSYAWVLLSEPSGSNVTLTSASTINPSLIPTHDGSYIIELTVSDTNSNSSTDTTTILTNTINAVPLAQAGIDKASYIDEVLSLDGSASSDVEGPINSYIWSITDKPAGSSASLLSSTTLVNPNFTGNVAGSYEVQLIVSDGTLSSVPDTLTIIVTQLQAVKKTGQDFFTISGEDGFYKKGAPLDYTLVSDIVRDGVTGLMWQDDNPSIYNPISGNNADAYCSALTLGSFTDWRLPLVDELLSIAKRNEFAPATNANYFRTIEASTYKFWSGTIINSTKRRLVDFYYGDESSIDNVYSYPVRCVRGSVATSSLQRDGTNGVVIDVQSKLIWQDNTNPVEEEWGDAIAYCEGLTLNSSNAWRLPNINELLTVIDFDSTQGIYKATFNFNPDNAWSSTTVVNKTSKAFSIFNTSGFFASKKPHVDSDESKNSPLLTSTRKNPKCVMDLP